MTNDYLGESASKIQKIEDNAALNDERIFKANRGLYQKFRLKIYRGVLFFISRNPIRFLKPYRI